jgi:hypothetical protein
MKMHNAIYGLYPNPDSAQRAVAATREAGVDPCSIVVLSSEPFEGYEFAKLDARTHMPWWAVVGGLLGGLSGYILAALTQRAYPVPTGGMPIVSLWPNGIITYELTMLGAILATLFTLLVAAHLPNWRKQLYDREVSAGKILVGVVDPPAESRPALQRRLSEAGADEVKEVQTD